MAPRTTYANLQDGLQNLSLWDASLADMGNLGIIPCTAVGTNAITLTPMASAFAPNVSNPPQQLQNFTFVAAATSTGAVTINGLKLYKEDGATQAAAGDLIINVLFGVAYNSALNSGAGGYQIAFPITSIVSPVITGATISGSTISGSTITTSTYNGNTWTAGTGTLTLAAGKTATISNTLTFTGTDGNSFSFPSGSDTVVTLAATQALSNKTTINLTDTGASGISITPASSSSVLTLNAPSSATNQAVVNMTDNGSLKWQIGKLQGNSFFIGDSVAVIQAISCTPSTSVNIGYATQSTSPATGSLIVTGGLGISKDAYGAGAILSTSPTAGVGYATGSGGAVTQATSKATGVSLSKASGAITMNNAALAAGTIVSFVLTNTAIAATDVLILNHISGGTPGSYSLNARAAAGSATIDVRNNTAGSLSEAMVIQFAVIKAVNA